MSDRVAGKEKEKWDTRREFLRDNNRVSQNSQSSTGYKFKTPINHKVNKKLMTLKHIIVKSLKAKHKVGGI